MVDAGILVFAAFIAPYRESRRFIRELMAKVSYFECYVKCGLETCEFRDPKGLYKKAWEGQFTGMTGITAPYETPESPDLIIETDQYSMDQCVNKLIRFLVDKKVIVMCQNGNIHV